MPTLDFVSSKNQEKKEIDIITLIATILFIGAVGFDAFVAYKFYDKSQKEKEYADLQVTQNSNEYKLAKEFYLLSSRIGSLQSSTVQIGDVLGKIMDATIDEVVYESVVYTEGGGSGGELKLKGTFDSAESVKEQVAAYQAIEEVGFVANTFDSDSVGKSASINAQGATIVIEL